MEIGQAFQGFSNLPIIFERDKTYKNEEPISDFLLNDWSEVIVSQKVYQMLKEKYSDEMDLYECFARDEGELKPYYIVRAKKLYDDLKAMNPTSFEVTPIATTSEELQSFL